MFTYDLMRILLPIELHKKKLATAIRISWKSVYK